jgi:L-fuculokinase
MIPVVAIIDVGKTNKKLFLFDRHYRIVWERTDQFAETTDDDDDPSEDLPRLRAWVLASVAEVLALPAFDVQALNVSAYGASLVYVGADGEPVGHLYNYLKPFPDALRQQFYAQYGPVDALSVQTASPALDSLNSGLQLYRLKHDRPALFAQVAFALHLPQYVAYLLNNRPVAEITSLGCHTLLWDFDRNDYHDWVKQENLESRLLPVAPSDSVISTDFGGNQVPVGIGLHDSSAALIPYLMAFGDSSFVLISTGTWCISLNPFTPADEPLTAEELQYDCLSYLSYRGQPVKASRLFAGHEHEQQTRRLARHFGIADDHYKHIQYDRRLLRQLQHHNPPLPEPARSASGLIAPNVMPLLAQSVFGRRALADFPDYETAYHQLMLDLMVGQLISTALVLPVDGSPGESRSGVSRIFVDGGFSQNPVYMNLLAAAFPQLEVWAASVAQASALGAALAIHAHWNPLPIPPDLIQLTRYPSPKPLII